MLGVAVPIARVLLARVSARPGILYARKLPVMFLDIGFECLAFTAHLGAFWKGMRPLYSEQILKHEAPFVLFV